MPRKEAPVLETMSGSELIDDVLESQLSLGTKHEFFEWLYAKRLIDAKQYKLADARMKHLDSKES